jgi:CheY-like chemotaxis protein
MRTRVLIVENDAVTALYLEGLLIEADYLLTGIAASPNEALELANRSPPDLVLLDIGIVDSVDGIELARRLQESFSLAHVYVTGHSEPEVLVRANHTSPLGFIVKPFDDVGLLTGIEIALCRSGQRCRAASDLGAPAPFVMDRHFPAFQPLAIARDVCPMQRRCSSHPVTAGWTDGDSLAAPGTRARHGAATPESAGVVATSWRPDWRPAR